MELKLYIIIFIYILNTSITLCTLQLNFVSLKMQEIMEVVYNEKYNNKEIFKILLNFEITTKLIIGNPPKKIRIAIFPKISNFLFDNKECTNKASDYYYNILNSSTYKINNYLIPTRKKTNIKRFISQDVIKMYNKNDYFYFEENFSINKSELKNISFFLFQEDIDNQKYCGMIGLSIIKTGPYSFLPSFIRELKNQKIIDNYNWYINFDSNYRGYIRIGDLPYKEKNNGYELLNIYTLLENKELIWRLQFNKIYIEKKNGDKFIINENNITKAILDYNLFGLICNKEYKNLIIKEFFDVFLKNNICNIITVNQENISYEGIVCNYTNFKYKMHNFPKLILFHKDFNKTFILSNDDLFIHTKKRIFFLIFWKIEDINSFNSIKDNWILGIPFLKRYQFVFNPDSNQLGYIKKINRGNHYDKSEETKYENSKYFINNNIKNKKINFPGRLLLEIVLGLLLIGTTLYFAKFFYKKRNKLANELVENYDYISSEDKKLFYMNTYKK